MNITECAGPPTKVTEYCGISHLPVMFFACAVLPSGRFYPEVFPCSFLGEK